MAGFGAPSRRGLFAALAAVFVVGCLSPTLPLPPPSRPLVTAPDAAGFVQVSGRVRSESTAFAQNMRTGRITGQTTDETGEYELELAAEVGDRLVIWYRLYGEESPTTEVLVPEKNPELSIGGAGGAP